MEYNKRLTTKLNTMDVEYEIYPLAKNDDPILSLVTPEFNFQKPPMDPIYLAVSIAQSMVHHWGVGLAAPQIGLPYRAFAMGAGGQVNVFFNPWIKSTEGETSFEEGCLTYKGLFLKIKRPSKVKVGFYDYVGQEHEGEYDGLTARTFLHELDHLNGIVYTSLVDRYIMDRAKSKVPANIRKLRAQRERSEKDQIIKEATKKVLARHKQEELDKELAASLNKKTDGLTLNIPNIEIVN